MPEDLRVTATGLAGHLTAILHLRGPYMEDPCRERLQCGLHFASALIVHLFEVAMRAAANHGDRAFGRYLTELAEAVDVVTRRWQNKKGAANEQGEPASEEG